MVYLQLKFRLKTKRCSLHSILAMIVDVKTDRYSLHGILAMIVQVQLGTVRLLAFDSPS